MHNLLKRQVKKYLSDQKWSENPGLVNFLDSINDSYKSFEEDKEFSQHAFDIADQEYFEITQRLLKEKKLREQSIAKLLLAVSQLEMNELINADLDKNDLLNIADYLEKQVKARKMMEKQLKRAVAKSNKASLAKSEFLSTISHELRSPLNVIVGITHILQSERHLPEQVENFKVLDISSKNLFTLINDVLDFEKIESGQLELDIHSFNIIELFEEIQLANQSNAKYKSNVLKLDVDNDIPIWVRGDRARIGQILTNLVNNAIKFTKNGMVEITTKLIERNSDDVVLRIGVKDNGIGISKENQERVFERFTQERSDTTRKYGGSGLGLAISKNLLNLMGSQIALQSSPNIGSHFMFDIKLETCEAIGLSTKNRANLNLSGARILIVDDLELNLFVIDKIMKDWNCKLDFASNGQEAIDKVRNNIYDLVLMDLQMPEIDGKTATLEIRKFNEVIPILAFTASTTEATRKSLMESGMNGYMSKPVDPKELYDKILLVLLQKV